MTVTVSHALFLELGGGRTAIQGGGRAEKDGRREERREGERRERGRGKEKILAMWEHVGAYGSMAEPQHGSAVARASDGRAAAGAGVLFGCVGINAALLYGPSHVTWAHDGWCHFFAF